MELVILLRHPGRVLIGDHHALLGYDGTPLCDGEMPMLAQCDLLLTKTRELVGLSLFDVVGRGKAFAAACDPRIVRYFSADEVSRLPRYKWPDANCGVLEFLVSRLEPEEWEIGQLNEDWLYDRSPGTDATFPAAYRYRHCEDIEQTFELRLPSELNN